MLAPLTLIMRVIRENLCGRANELSLDEMLKAAVSDDPAELQFRCVMSFLAAPLQTPGLNLQTNLWLLGNVQGLGRGTLTALILTRLYGSNHVAILNPDEIQQGGWTDVIEGKLIVVVNELNPKSKTAAFWNTLIKRLSTDAIIPIRKRGTHGHDALNFANWIFTSNNQSPQCLDSENRRDALIATTTDKTKAALATELYEWMDDNDGPVLDRMLGGLMQIFLNHKVDCKLVNRAPQTELKADVLEAAGDDNGVRWWLENSDRYLRDVDLPAADYLPDYLRLTPSQAQMDVRTFGGILSELARSGDIVKTQRYKTQPGKYRISSEKFPVPSNEAAREKPTPKPPFSLVPGGKAKWSAPRSGND